MNKKAQNMIIHNFIGCKLNDIIPTSCGYEECSPDKIVGPRKWLGSLIHYVECGKGSLEKNGQIYRIEKGDVFVINYGEMAKYYPDQNDPWTYRWICFSGALVPDFAALPPVFKYSGDIFREICDLCDSNSTAGNKGTLISSVILRWYGKLFSDSGNSTDYAENIKRYIDRNYMYPINVNHIAEQMNMSRSYITKLFKKYCGYSVREYLTYVRLTKAKYYLEIKKNVSETAYLCGYSDPSNFSRMFTKFYGVSPQKYREYQSFEIDENPRKKKNKR